MFKADYKVQCSSEISKVNNFEKIVKEYKINDTPKIPNTISESREPVFYCCYDFFKVNRRLAENFKFDRDIHCPKCKKKIELYQYFWYIITTDKIKRTMKTSYRRVFENIPLELMIYNKFSKSII